MDDFHRLTQGLCEEIVQAFAIPAPIVVGVVDETYDGDDKPAETEPLPPVYGPLCDILTEQETWATNGFWIVYRTQLDTFHVYILHTRCYVANYIEEDLKHFLQGRYNEHLSEDFTKYSQPEYAAMFDVDAPLWRLRENPFNDSY
jgi:hypothetical protein